jgi:hypothetical protein
MTEEEKVKEIKSRMSQLEQNRSRFIDRWTEAQKYVAPVVYDWHNLDSIPEIPSRYTSAPCNYLDILVSGLVGYSASPNIQWYKLMLENSSQMDEYGVKDWLEETEEVMNAEFNRSNFYTQIKNIIQSAAVIGHGIMLCDEDLAENKLRFSAIKANEIFLDADESGKIDTIFRKYLMTLRNAVEFFGIENLDQNLQEDYKDSAKWNNKVEILFAVFPRKEYNEDIKDSLNKPFAAIYVDLKHNKIIKESGYDENPYAVFEWDQIPGLAYSNSPAICALPDIKELNIAKKTSMEICQTSAEPPMRISSSIRNVSLVPRGFTFINTPDEIIEPIRTGENYPITLSEVEGMKQAVKDWFNVDFFLMLQQKQGRMTATEVQELQGEKSAVLSNLVISLNETLTQVIQRSFNLLVKQDKIPPLPISLEGQAAAMKIDFIGPLSMAQKKYHTLGGIQQALALVGPIMQMFPNSGDYIDPDVLMKRALEGQGMPQAVIREDEDVKKLREARAQAQMEAQQQAQQQQMMQSMMQNADKLGKTPEAGSALADIDSQMAGAMEQNA